MFEQRPAESEYAPYYNGYITLAGNGDIRRELREQIDEMAGLFGGLGEEMALHRYAPGKWSIKELVGHMADGEQIFGYRALRISRNDPTPLAGFDEDAYVIAAGFDRIPIADLVEAWAAARRSNLCLFEQLDPAAWSRTGVANGNPISVRAIAYICAGHATHHMNVVRQRYL